MKTIYHPSRDSLVLPPLLHALGDPVRLAIVKRLATGDELTCNVAYPYPIPKSTLSHHIKILREAGLIHVRQQGREYYSHLRFDDIELRFPGVLQAILRVTNADSVSTLSMQ